MTEQELASIEDAFAGDTVDELFYVLAKMPALIAEVRRLQRCIEETPPRFVFQGKQPPRITEFDDD